VAEEKPIRILAALPPALMADLQTLMAALSPGNAHGVILAGLTYEGTALETDAVEKEADVVLLSPELPALNLEAVQRLYHHPDRPILTIALVEPNTDWARTMGDAGAVGHVTRPLSQDGIGRLAQMAQAELRKACQYRASDKYVPQLSARTAAVVDRGGWMRAALAFWSPTGGVGKTTLATNVAVALGVLANKRVALVDADMNKGNVHLLLGMQQAGKNIYSLATAYQQAGQMTPTMAQGHLTPYLAGRQPTGLQVLMGLPQQWMAAKEPLAREQGMRFFEALLDVLRISFDFVVLDVGQTYNSPVHYAALKGVDSVFLVVNSSITSLTDARQALKALQDAGLAGGERMRVVVNKYHPRHGISRRNVQRTLDEMPVFHEIAMADDELPTIALNAGEPLILHDGKSPASQNILTLATTLYPPLADIQRLRGGKKKRRGLFS
jgi:pilus assembly protein CpaE